MENVWIDSEILDAIGDALRYQHHTNKRYYPHEMADAIASAEGVSESTEDYFGHEINGNTSETLTGLQYLLKKLPKASPNDTTTNSFQNVFYGYLPEVSPVIDSSQITNFSRMFYGSKIKKVLPFDTSNGINFSAMFVDCTNLITIPKLDLSKGTDFSSMFSSCTSLNKIPKLDMDSGTNFSSMFSRCSALTSIPSLETSNGVNFSYMFSRCSNLTTIAQLDMSSGTNFTDLFEYCSSLENLGGFLNIGQAFSTTASANYSNYRLFLNYGINLTHQSLMNVINCLYDIATRGCKTQSLNIGAYYLSKLTVEEIEIATNKG